MNVLSNAQIDEARKFLVGRAHGDSAYGLERHLGLETGDLLDLATSMNPVAPDFSPLLLGHLDSLKRYPDATKSREALAEALEVESERLILCNGGAEAIELVSKLVTRGFVKSPDFSLYRTHISSYDPTGPWWASNPNNPIGTLLDKGERPDVVDEAFYQIATGSWTRRDFEHGSFVLGSLTKLFGLPGLRIGYLVCPDAQSAGLLNAKQPKWEVNSLAAASLGEMLGSLDLKEVSGSVAKLREKLVSILRASGFKPSPSAANYVYVPEAGELLERLLRHKVLVRDTGSFGLSGGVRIAVPNEDGLGRIQEALSSQNQRKARVPRSKGSLMIVGTGSDSGKSTLVTALCRILSDREISVAPFKSQNMSLNSAVTPSGHEIGRAQERQARASRISPEVSMNPILLKPTSDMTSQVVVLGEPAYECSAKEYQVKKRELLDIVLKSYAFLSQRFDVILLEGAGSPAEINLLENDIVNLGLANRVGAKALLVGDIDRGGAFASLFGTVAILPDTLSRLIGGFVINKIRGDSSLLDSGISRIEALTSRKVFGVIPYFEDMHVDAEDSLALSNYGAFQDTDGDGLDIAVIAFPRLSNFTDFDPLVEERHCNVRLVNNPGQLGDPDLIVLPGSKSTAADLTWLKRRGFDRAINRSRSSGTVILGICGGYQIMGGEISDDFESRCGTIEGLGLLEVMTRFERTKVTLPRRGVSRYFGGVQVSGYQIHQGRVATQGSDALFCLNPPVRDFPGVDLFDGAVDKDGVTFGTTLHGIFEGDEFRLAFLSHVASLRGKQFESTLEFHEFRDRQIDDLARIVSKNLDVDRLLTSMFGLSSQL